MGQTSTAVKNSAVGQAFKAEVTKAVNDTIADPQVEAQASHAGTADIINAVFTQIIPIIAHSTNQEPWYRSRVFWSAIVSVAGMIAGIFGVTLDSDTQQQISLLIMTGSQAVAAVLAIWGRYANKPLGK